MKIHLTSLSVLAFVCFFNLYASALDCSKKAGSLPFPDKPPGTRNPAVPVEHIFVIMQENHSFDSYFGALSKKEFYGSEVDGIQNAKTLHDEEGVSYPPYQETNFCPSDPPHDWNSQHNFWNKGLNDGFVKHAGMGKTVMGYHDEKQLPLYYQLANQFAIGDRYFASAIGPTFPNRYFLYAASAFGHTQNIYPKKGALYTAKTIFDMLTEHKISWKYYYTPRSGYLEIFPALTGNSKNVARLDQLKKDLDAGALPEVVFIESAENTYDEHPPANVLDGQKWFAGILNDIYNHPAWKTSAVFLTYDENGGFYDHVAPPKACPPDDIAVFNKEAIHTNYDHLGFRVPFIAISPFAKRHYVSHQTYDHTSILKFIEIKYNLPALTGRDANTGDLMDMFDFGKPNYNFEPLPDLSKVEVNGCYYPSAFAINTYNIIINWLVTLWTDLKDLWNR